MRCYCDYIKILLESFTEYITAIFHQMAYKIIKTNEYLAHRTMEIKKINLWKAISSVPGTCFNEMLTVMVKMMIIKMVVVIMMMTECECGGHL